MAERGAPDASDAVALAQITAEPIDADAVAAAVVDARHGGLVVFHGIVRDHDGGRAVAALGYEAHPSAEAELGRVAREVAAAVPDVRIALVHRVGDLRIGDTALVCAVASAHRAEAFAACERAVDALKRDVPIWKHQRFADGAAEWVGIADTPARSLDG